MHVQKLKESLAILRVHSLSSVDSPMWKALEPLRRREEFTKISCFNGRGQKTFLVGISEIDSVVANGANVFSGTKPIYSVLDWKRNQRGIGNGNLPY